MKTARSANPAQWTHSLPDGSVIRVRPIAPDDAPREQEFLAHLPPHERSYRFLGLVKPPSETVARELTVVDPGCELELVAMTGPPRREREVGVARFRCSDDCSHCDCAVAVDPQWQRLGIGALLMRHLIDCARRRGVRRMYAVDALRCDGAHHLAERLGFRCRPDPEDPAVTTFELEVR